MKCKCGKEILFNKLCIVFQTYFCSVHRKEIEFWGEILWTLARYQLLQSITIWTRSLCKGNYLKSYSCPSHTSQSLNNISATILLQLWTISTMVISVPGVPSEWGESEKRCGARKKWESSGKKKAVIKLYEIYATCVIIQE